VQVVSQMAAAGVDGAMMIGPASSASNMASGNGDGDELLHAPLV
jgi:hypothetical protein